MIVTIPLQAPLLLFILSLIQAFPVQPLSRKPPSSLLFAEVNRRDVLSLPILGLGLSLGSAASQAQGLVQFPCAELGNTYHFMRAGESLLEADDIWSTNPLFVTNREAALSNKGIEEVEAALEILKKNNVNPSIIRYAIAASSTDTSNLVGRELKVGRDRMVPEFNYLEPRAVGAWDMLEWKQTEKAVWAMDATEAGKEGTGGRPPPNEDGTPNDTLADQAVRLRQLISVLESQYSGDVVLLIACDGTSLALLSCMIAGIPYDRVHEMEFSPGEVRMNVNKESILAMWKDRQENLLEYKAAIQEGTVELKRLREMKDVVNVKDRRMEKEQQEMEATYQAQQAEKRRVEAEDRTAREARARQIEEVNGGPIISPLAAASVGFGALGVAVAVGTTPPADEREIWLKDSKDHQPPAPSEESEGLDGQSVLIESMMMVSLEEEEERVFDPILDGVQSKNPLQWTASKDALKTVNGDREADFTPEPIKAPPKQSAEQAMQEYLDQDDGATDWLLSLTELIDDEDEQ